MSFVHASAFTSLTDTPARPNHDCTSQQRFNRARPPQTTSQRLTGHTLQPYQFSANMIAVSSEDPEARLDATYSTRVYASTEAHGHQFLDTLGYPVTCGYSSTAGPLDEKKNSNPWPTSNGPLSKHLCSPMAPLPCGSGKTAARGDKVSTLKSWLYEHRKNPYPTKGEKVMLAVITKMTLTQVSTWFANARRRLKKDTKTTLSAVVRRRDDGDDDDTTVDRNGDKDDNSCDGNEVGHHHNNVTPASNIKSRKSRHRSTDNSTREILQLNKNITGINDDDDVDNEKGHCKKELHKAAPEKTLRSISLMADSTKGWESSSPKDRSELDSTSHSLMSDEFSVGEKQITGQFPLKIKRDRNGYGVKRLAPGRSSSMISGTLEKQLESQVSSPEVSSSTCSRPRIWSVTEFINTSLPSTEVSTTLPLSSTTATTPSSSRYSNLPSAYPWISNPLVSLITTAAVLPSAPAKTVPGLQHPPVSNDGVIHWPASASAFARLTSGYQPRSTPYPNTAGRFGVRVNSQQSAAVVEDRSWQTLCLHPLYQGFPSRVVFSSP